MKLALSTRLLAALAVVCAMAVTIASIGAAQLGGVSRQLVQSTESLLPQIDRLQTARMHMVMISLETRHLMLASDTQEIAATRERIGGHVTALQAALKAYEDALVNERARSAFREVRAAEAGFFAAAGKLGPLIEQGRIREAFAELSANVVPARNALIASTDAQLEKLSAERAENERLATQTAAATRDLMLGLAAFAAVLATLLGWWILRSVTGQLGGDPRAALAIADRVASGDLATPIALRAGDESSLLAALAKMQSQLADVVGEVRRNAGNVVTVTDDMARGHRELAGSTRDQAQGLRDVAVAMQDVGRTVEQSAAEAREASQLAAGATEVAARGGEVVGRVVGTMQGIAESSRRISEIIGTIDSIAFQTNILALNAAVEAARAGEQGRGFAVVANAVRSLAQDSGNAARQIKDLIGDSVERVEQGSQLVAQAGDTMQEIIGAIRRVADIVAHISETSAEQSSRVGELTRSVGSMDGETTRNAELVQRSAALSEDLRTQARRLEQAVAAFRLQGGSADAAPGRSHDAHGAGRAGASAAAPLPQAA